MFCFSSFVIFALHGFASDLATVEVFFADTSAVDISGFTGYGLSYTGHKLSPV